MAATKGHGNPRWSRDETLLALELYLTCKGIVPGPADERVLQLSEELRRLPIYPADKRRETFRNPEGVAFKLQNLRQVATGRGLGNVSETDKEVWAAYGHQPETVARLTMQIREVAANAELAAIIDDDDFEFLEGRLLTKQHKYRERHGSVRPTYIARRLKMNATFACDACGVEPKLSNLLSPDAGYEVHHNVPLALSSAAGVASKFDDLALLCAVCHRLIHRLMSAERRWKSVADLRDLLKDNSGKSRNPL